MKRFWIFIASFLILSAQAADAKDLRESRRTLFVPVGQITLAFEAPAGMCFMDQTTPFESAMYKAFRSVVQKKNNQVLLAVFSACDNIASLDGKMNTRNIPLNSGIITWMNPSIGDTTALEKTEYLDMRESSLIPYIKGSALFRPGFFIDSAPHRTEHNVSIGLDGAITRNGEKSKTSVVLATASLRHIPIEVTLRFTEKEPLPLKEIYRMMDKFMAQQAALNK